MSRPKISSDLIFQVYRRQQADQISKSELYDLIVQDLDHKVSAKLLSSLWYLANIMSNEVQDNSCLCTLDAFVSLLDAIHEFKVEYAINGTPQE